MINVILNLGAIFLFIPLLNQIFSDLDACSVIQARKFQEVNSVDLDVALSEEKTFRNSSVTWMSE